MSARRCDWCKRFVSNRHPATVRHCYAIDFDSPVTVYSLATATRLVTQLLCRDCAPAARCFAVLEAERGEGTAIGRHLPNGWEKCSPEATSADYAEAS